MTFPPSASSSSSTTTGAAGGGGGVAFLLRLLLLPSPRAAGLLAHTCARLGHHEEAEAWFKQATALSTASELAVHYAEFLEQVRAVTAAYQADGLLTSRNRQRILLAAGQSTIDAQ